MSFRVLLLSPPIFDFYFTPARKEPLGLLYIKRALEEIEDIEVELCNATYSGKIKRIIAPKCFDYLSEFYVDDSSYFSLFHKYYRFGDSFDKIIKKINQRNYHLVVISSLFSAYHPSIEELTKRIKNETKALVAIGGWAVSVEYERIRQNGYADFYLTGDGDCVIPELIKTLKRGVNPDLYGYKFSLMGNKRGATSSKAQISSLFFESYPAREGTYTFRRKKIASMITSKGCCFRCDFCSVHRRYDFVIRPIEKIEEEIDYLYQKGIEIINFEDDNLFYNPSFTQELMAVLKQYHQKGICYTCMNGMPALSLLPVLDKAIKAGFIEFNLSLVSQSSSALKQISRPIMFGAIREIAMKSVGKVDVVAFIIAGLPGTNLRNLIDDVVFLAGLPLRIGFSPLYLLPGIKMFERMGLPEDRRLLRGSALYKFPKGFERSDIASIWKYIRMINKIKTFTQTLTEEDEKNLMYFKRSLKEKVWYARDKTGKWYQTFSFTTPLPDKIQIVDLKGNVSLLEF